MPKVVLEMLISKVADTILSKNDLTFDCPSDTRKAKSKRQNDPV